MNEFKKTSLRKKASKSQKDFIKSRVHKTGNKKIKSLSERLKQAKKKRSALSFVQYAVLIGLGLVIVGALSALIMLFVAVAQLPSAEELVAKTVAAQSTKILDRNGELLYEVHGDERRTVVALDQISPYLVKATLAAEDDEFYLHPGYDWKGMLRSVYIIVVSRLTGGSGQTVGGSTITQQFVKNAYLSREKRIVRKIKELILSLKLESNLQDREGQYTEDQAHWIDFGLCDEGKLGLENCLSLIHI